MNMQETHEQSPTEAYYDEKNKLLVLTAMTDPAFRDLVSLFNKPGFGLDAEPDIRVCPSMIITTEEILRKKVKLPEYDRLFAPASFPEEQANLEKLNRLLQLALPAINAGRKPDIAELARQVGLEQQTAKEVLDQILGRVDHLRKR